jgi:hypothetical protein
MTEESQKPSTQNEEYGIAIDLSNNEIEVFKVSETPKSWPFGMFVGLRTGTREQMESFRASLIANSLKSLRRMSDVRK